MSTRTAKTAAKKTAAKTAPAAQPRKRTAKKTARAADRTPKAELPTRTKSNEWMTDLQGHATLHALLADITTPHIRDWHDHGDGTATRSYDNGTLTYRHTDRQLTWTAECPRGAHHEYVLAAPGDFQAARRHLGWCTDPHMPQPAVRTLRALGDNLTKSTSATAETQPMPLNQIAAGLNARTAEQPKEHPAP